jgi:hypothetical protein
MRHDYGSGIEINPVSHAPRRPRRIKKYLSGKNRMIPANGGPPLTPPLAGLKQKMFFLKKNLKQKMSIERTFCYE